MVDALKWGGASYHGAGWNPRHIEGVEHFIFYALEAQTGKRFLHGQAVCLGLILGTMMHDQRTEELLDAVRYLGVDIRPAAMDINWDDVTSAMHGLKDFVNREGAHDVTRAGAAPPLSLWHRPLHVPCCINCDFTRVLFDKPSIMVRIFRSDGACFRPLHLIGKTWVDLLFFSRSGNVRILAGL